MFASSPYWRLYRDRLLCVALCQGAALHYLDGRNGIKDFDVWTFFAAHPERPFPDPALYRRNAHYDFGRSRFGRRPQPHPKFRHYIGRNVDMLARALDVSPVNDPIAALRDWLSRPQTDTQRYLAAKAVVLLEPSLGTVVWPPKRTSRVSASVSSHGTWPRYERTQVARSAAVAPKEPARLPQPLSANSRLTTTSAWSFRLQIVCSR